MGRAPCCDKANVKKGPWSPEEDTKLKEYIEKHGTGGNWIALPHKAGLKRCGKSCRLRWLNYLRPNIKHGDFSDDEDRIICSLFASIGSRWSIIAAQLPGRTDNDIKNYWNTKLKKKLLGIPPSHRKPHQQPQPQPQDQCFFLQSSLQNTDGNPYNPPKPLPTGLEGFQFSQDVLSTPHHLHQYPMDGGSSSDGSCTQISYGKERELDMGFESYLFGEIEETQKLLLGGEAPLEYSYEEMKQLLGPNSGCNTLCFEDPISGGASRGDISFRAQGRVMYYY